MKLGVAAMQRNRASSKCPSAQVGHIQEYAQATFGERRSNQACLRAALVSPITDEYVVGGFDHFTAVTPTVMVRIKLLKIYWS